MPASAPVADDAIAPFLERAIKKHVFTATRSNMLHRVQLLLDLPKKIRDRFARDEDCCLSCGAGLELFDDQTVFGRCMRTTRPGCLGSEICDVWYVDVGLKGDDESECSSCREVLKSDTSVVLVTLPCCHVFHAACTENWPGSDCPSCRQEFPGHISIYRNDCMEQLQKHCEEYPMSGFCVPCQLKIMENSRVGINYRRRHPFGLCSHHSSWPLLLQNTLPVSAGSCLRILLLF